MKVIVFGGTNNQKYKANEVACSERLGEYLADIGAEVLTGACDGFPRFVGRAAVKKGGKVTGYSPALNEKEHVEKYKFPLDGVSHMEYIKEDECTQAGNFIQRSYEMTPFSDIVIALGGSWGTYIEVIFSLFFKKTIILIEEFGGAVEAFNNTYKFFDERDFNPVVHLGAKIIRVAKVDDAITAIESLRNK